MKDRNGPPGSRLVSLTWDGGGLGVSAEAGTLALHTETQGGDGCRLIGHVKQGGLKAEERVSGHSWSPGRNVYGHSEKW